MVRIPLGSLLFFFSPHRRLGYGNAHTPRNEINCDDTMDTTYVDECLHVHLATRRTERAGLDMQMAHETTLVDSGRTIDGEPVSTFTSRYYRQCKSRHYFAMDIAKSMRCSQIHGPIDTTADPQQCGTLHWKTRVLESGLFTPRTNGVQHGFVVTGYVTGTLIYGLASPERTLTGTHVGMPLPDTWPRQPFRRFRQLVDTNHQTTRSNQNRRIHRTPISQRLSQRSSTGTDRCSSRR